MSDAQFEQAMKTRDFRNRINRVYVHFIRHIRIGSLKPIKPALTGIRL